MTGPERETLTVLLTLLKTVQDDVREVKDTLSNVDRRVQAMETKDATQVAVAATTSAIAAANNARAEKRSLSVRAWVAIALTAGAALSTLVLRVLEVLNPH